MEGQQEFSRRLSQVRQAMRDKGLHALLVYEGGRHNFLRMNYVAYLTDFISVGPETVLVVPLEDAPALYLSPVWDIPRAHEESWVSEVRPFKEFWSSLSRISGKVGLIGREAMDISFNGEIVKTLGQTPANAKDIIENMARCKSDFELERLRRAAAIADAALLPCTRRRGSVSKNTSLPPSSNTACARSAPRIISAWWWPTTTIRRSIPRPIESRRKATLSSARLRHASAACSCKSAAPWCWENRRRWYVKNTPFSRRRWVWAWKPLRPARPPAPSLRRSTTPSLNMVTSNTAGLRLCVCAVTDWAAARLLPAVWKTPTRPNWKRA